MKISKDLVYLLGVIGGDGSIYIRKGKEYTLRIYDKSEEFVKNVLVPLVEKVFKVKPRVRFVKERNSWYVTIRSKKLIETLTETFKYSSGKMKTYSDHIPPQIFELDKDLILHHLGGWIDAEGHSRLNPSPRIELETVNRNFATELYLLSTQVGVPSTKPLIAKRKYRKDQKERYVICWVGKEKCKFLLQFMRHPQKINRLNVL